jgi:hypothetical protein
MSPLGAATPQAVGRGVAGRGPWWALSLRTSAQTRAEVRRDSSGFMEAGISVAGGLGAGSTVRARR